MATGGVRLLVERPTAGSPSVRGQPKRKSKAVKFEAAAHLALAGRLPGADGR